MDEVDVELIIHIINYNLIKFKIIKYSKKKKNRKLPSL